MVAHNGSDYLPRTLSALAGQTRPADRAIGVDAGSRDDSRALLEQALGAASVVTHDHGKGGMGAAVAAGLAALAPWRGQDAGGKQEWIWLLHDDAAPAPEALAELLGAVERAPSVTVAGCKQLDWHAERKLIDVGLSTSRWAERLTLIDADELDQGQYDGRSDTFAVNSAGMLVRRDVWEHLGGFDPALPGSGDDVDFCWRNRLAGHRVVVVPAARMFHVVHRPHALGNPAAARKAQVHLRLKHGPPWMVPVHAAGALLGSIFRLVLSIALKDPGHGLSQFLATAAALGRPGAVLRARRNARGTRRIRRSVIRKLQTPRREVWSHRRSLMEAIGSDGSQAEDLEQDPLAHQPTGDAPDDFAALATTRRGWVGNGALAAVIVASVASLLGLAGIFRADAVAGGALLPVSARLGDIWQHATSWWIALGAGLPGRGDPFGYVLWILGVLGGGDANAAMAWLLLLSTPLSALTAWFAAGGLTVRRRLRLAAALFWSAAPALQIALNQGRVGALVAHVMIPLLVLALLRATGSAVGHGRFALPAGDSAGERPPVRPGINGTPSWTAAAAAGLVMAVVTASAPSLLAPATAVIVLCGLLLGRRGRTIWWALLPAAALFIPFGLSVLDKPRALLADPGLPLGFTAAPLWQQTLGQPLAFDPGGGVEGLPYFQDGPVPWGLLLSLLLAAPVLVLAAAGLFSPGRRGRMVKSLWLAGLIALAGSWLMSQPAVSLNAGTLVAPFTGPAVSAASFVLLGAALLGAEQLLSVADKAPASAKRRRAAARSAVAVGMVLVLVGALAGMAAWSARNLLRPAAAAAGPAGSPDAALSDAGRPQASGSDAPGLGTSRLVEPVNPRTLPATAIDRGIGPEQTRTLLINTGGDGGFDAALMRGAGTTLDSLSAVASARNIMGAPGSETIREDDDVTASLRRVVATLVAGQGVDPRSDLEDLGVGFVVLRSADTAAQLTASRMDAVPGLVAVGQTDVGWLWRITPLNQPVLQPADITHRVRIVDTDGATTALVPSSYNNVDAQVPAGPEGRLVVLAERADTGWTAWLDGRRLTSTTSGWSQAFTLPASGGHLEIRYDNPWAVWTGIAQGTVIGLTVMLAIPMPARRPRTGISRDEGSLRKEQQNA